MKYGISIIVFLFASMTLSGQENNLSPDQQDAVLELITHFKNNDIDKISEVIVYPLKRAYPLKDIQNQQDFKKRFYEVFDSSFVRVITNSKPEDWSKVGWRGIMLQNGSLWLEDDGTAIIAVNYQSAEEKDLLNKAIEADRETLPDSLKNYKQPEYLIKTPTYKIRIDELYDYSLRYACWKLKKTNTIPDLVLYNGNLTFQGSGGNHTISFQNGAYTYIIHINKIGSVDTPDVYLDVLKEDKILLRESGIIIRN